MVWNCSIVAVTLLFGVSGKSKAFRNEVKRLEKKQRGVAYMSKLINDLVGNNVLSDQSSFLVLREN